MKKYNYIFLINALFLLLSFTVVNAATFLIGNPSGQGAVYTTIGLDKPVYQPGENIVAQDIYMQSYSPIANQVSLGAGTNGFWIDILLSSIMQGQSIFGNNKVIGLAPSNVGTYNANFTTGYYLPGIPVVGYVSIQDNGSAVGCVPGNCAGSGTYVPSTNVCLSKRWEIGDPYPTPSYTLPESISFNTQWKEFPYVNWSYATINIPTGQSCGSYVGTTKTYNGLFAPEARDFCMSTSSTKVEIYSDIKC